MANKMLIDAAHPEETRVVVLRGNRIEEFDFESSTRKQLRGNIYLAKVTRVEPSLQAAFVDYGGNRHGFLAFSEIHPDYYQIPVADRQALLEQEAAEDIADLASEEAEEEPADEKKPAKSKGRKRRGKDPAAAALASAPADEVRGDSDADNGPVDPTPDTSSEASGGNDEEGDEDVAENVESVGAEDALAEVPRRRRTRERRYKIQEVIKRRQIILVQVVKEERGTKGAALTTYLSLAGRYCVLMPNTARGGGISRKITNPADRRRLKDVAGNLSVPEGTGLIVRTAGAQRTKAEIKRDFEYLLRLWETVRDHTLQSSAPALVYEEGSLIKRSLRDLYNKDIADVEIEGDEGYKEAKSFMRMLMPSHAKNIKAYKDNQPLFMRHQIENQLDSLFQPRVTLKSGGYLIINQTEALVSIDVNSGRSTREHNIEDTALKTNLEAAEEVARQLRLRDLAGLIVIDFIDMEERRNNRSVERRMKECLKNERARIQVGRISHFGLLEMSRQRMRAGVVEGSTRLCEACEGRGFVRSVESAALFVLRAIEEQILKGRPTTLTVSATTDVVLYILNQKRDHLLAVQAQYGVTVYLNADAGLTGIEFEIGQQAGPAADKPNVQKSVRLDTAFSEADISSEEEEQKGRRKRRRRRRGRKRDVEATDNANGAAGTTENDMPAASSDEAEVAQEPKPKSRQRGRRSRGRAAADATPPDSIVETAEQVPGDNTGTPVAEATEKPKRTRKRTADKDGTDDKPKRSSQRRRAKPAAETKPDDAADSVAAQPANNAPAGEPAAKKTEPRKTRKSETRKKSAAAGDKTPADSSNGQREEAGNGAAPADVSPAPSPAPREAPENPRSGWWQRRS